MKQVFTLFTLLLLLVVNNASAQQWTWLTGGNTPNVLPNYTDDPGGRQGAAMWSGNDGKIYIFGGKNFDYGYIYADLWAYDTLGHQWSFVSGSQTPNTFGFHGTLGIIDDANQPGARESAATWIDSNGNLWLFGGLGYGESTGVGELNDLWMFQPSSGQWTWMGGSNETNAYGVYGEQGVPALANMPGTRHDCSYWVYDDNLYLFGGNGFGLTSTGYLNDLWKYSINDNLWVHLSGNNVADVGGNYGNQNVPSPCNQPGSRAGSCNWTASDGSKLYLFGGSVAITSDRMNDLWQYDLTTNNWTWISGTNLGNDAGVYGSLNVASIDYLPAGRLHAVSFTQDNYLWLFGGYTYYYVNDVWRYNLSNGEWTWMGGNVAVGDTGYYLEQGPSSLSNYPSNKEGAIGCTTDDDTFWLFGGTGSVGGVMNDLWRITVPNYCNVTFQLDMSEVTNFMIPEVNGTFDGWCGNCFAMSDDDGDNVWSLTAIIPAGNYQFKYSTDNWSMQETLLPEMPCTMTDLGGFTNRQLTIDGDTILPVVCWSSCSACDPQPIDCNALSGTLLQGLVGYWPFCGNANDESGNGNDGVVNGATLTEDRFGVSGHAFYFNGQEDHIEIVNSSSLSPTSLSISAWIKIPSNNIASGYSSILTKWWQGIACGNNSDSYALYADNSVNAIIGASQYNTASPTFLSSDIDLLQYDQWYHLTFIHDELDGQLLYLNGNLIAGNGISGALCPTTNNLFFGCDNNQGTLWRFFNGFLDDIAIWNRALTQEEIAQLFGDFGTPIAGCTDSSACNFNADATIDDPTQCCFENCVTLTMNDSGGDGWNGATVTIMDAIGNVYAQASLFEGVSGTATVCLPDGCYTLIAGWGTNDSEISWTLTGITGGPISGGATDILGTNFSTGCVICGPGCTNIFGCNYNPWASADDGSCIYPDCTNPNAINYNPEAGCDDGSCIIPTPNPSAQVLSYAGPLDILHCTEGHIGGVYIQNTGMPTLNGFITIECDEMFTPIPANSFITPMATSTPGSGIWQFLNYTTGMENVFSYFVEGPGVDFIGNSYPFTMSVMIYDESGNIVVDQTWTQNLEVTCAYDPNDLTPRPLGYTDNHFIEAGDTVLFRVRFQNLGNAAATNVHIDIPLDSTVWDFNSFEQAFPLALEVGCLHDPGDVDYATGILEYELNNIQLPDSASDPVGSMRSFHFRLRARTDLPAGTVLLNQALIYFDENPPIYTNQTYHTIFDCTSFTPMVGDDTYCLGDTILLQATQPYVDSYSWSVDGFSASGDTLRYAPLVAGTYDIALQTTNALCVNGEWHNTTVNVFALPELDVPLNASLCAGETITFAAASNAPVSWSNGANTGDTIEATESFTVTASAVGEGDCAVSEDWSVTVNTPPSTTVIADGNTLTATDGVAWQWYLNGLPLAGETGMSIETTPNENYTVVITGANGCVVDTTVTEVHQALAQVVRIYPNPMREQTQIVLPEGTFDMVLHDMMGRSVWQRSSQRGTVSLERGTLASGVYQLRMSNADTHFTTPLILE